MITNKEQEEFDYYLRDANYYLEESKRPNANLSKKDNLKLFEKKFKKAFKIWMGIKRNEQKYANKH